MRQVHSPERSCPGFMAGRWTSPSGFTLIELLIVIGLLGALATLVLSSLSVTRTEILDDSIVQSELAEIQRAFQRFKADCVPSQEDYQLISRSGLEILMKYEARGWTFDGEWNTAQNKGWRGPYIGIEALRISDTDENDSSSYSLSTKGQRPAIGGTEIPVVETPYMKEEDSTARKLSPDFYRVLPEINPSGNITELYALAKVSESEEDAALNALAVMTNIEGNTETYRQALEDYLEANPSHRRLILE